MLIDQANKITLVLTTALYISQLTKQVHWYLYILTEVIDDLCAMRDREILLLGTVGVACTPEEFSRKSRLVVEEKQLPEEGK